MKYFKKHTCYICKDKLKNPSFRWDTTNYSVNDILRELKNNNPYPRGIFKSVKGKAAFHAYNLALWEVKRKMEEEENGN